MQSLRKFLTTFLTCSSLLLSSSGLENSILMATDVVVPNHENKFEFDGGNFVINLNKVPAANDKVHEGGLCELKQKSVDDTEPSCLKDDPNDTNANRHTRKYFSDITPENFEFSCSRVGGADSTVKTCIANTGTSGLTPTPCFADWECCSGYCQPAEEISSDYKNPTRIKADLQGQCMPMPANYSSNFPYQPAGKPAKAECSEDGQCQSRICDGGKCKAASVCTRCTPEGKKPVFGAPCCGASAYSLSSNTCEVVDKRFEPLKLSNIIATGAGEDLTAQISASNSIQGLQIRVPDAATSKGNCSMQMSISSNASTDSMTNAQINDIVQQDVYTRDALISLLAFLQLWKSSTNPKQNTDHFGIHAQLNKAMAKYLQAKYDTFFQMKRFEAENHLKIATLNAEADLESLTKLGAPLPKVSGKNDATQTAILDIAKSSYQVQKEIAVTMRDAIAEAYIELNDNYVKEEKDRNSDAPEPKYTLTMLLAGNRSAGRGTGNCAVDPTKTLSEDGNTCLYANVDQEETDEGVSGDGEEGEERMEEGWFQTGMIYRTSTPCDRTDYMEEYVEDHEEIEEEDDGEQGSFQYNQLSRFCVGKSDEGTYVDVSGSRDSWYRWLMDKSGVIALTQEQKTALWQGALNGRSGDYAMLEDWDDNPQISLVNTYPAYTRNDSGAKVNVAAGGASSENIRANLLKFINDPVKHSYELEPHAGDFTLDTASAEAMVNVDSVSLQKAKDAAAIAANSKANFLDLTTKSILENFTRPEFKTLDSMVYHASASYTRMQPTAYRGNFILLMSFLLHDLYSFYDKTATALEQMAQCFEGVNDENKKTFKAPGGGGVSDGSTSGPAGADNIAVTIGGAGSGTSSNLASGGGQGQNGAGFGINNLNGLGGAGFGSGSTTGNKKSLEQRNKVAGIFGEHQKIMAGAKRRKNIFDKNFKGTLMAAKEDAKLQDGSSVLGEMVSSAGRAVAAVRGKGGLSSPSGSLLGSNTGLTDPSAQGSAGTTAGAASEEGAEEGSYQGQKGGGRGGRGSRGNNSSGGSDNAAPGAPDEHNLMEAMAKDKTKFTTKEGDSIWKMITNRYMSTLDRILEKKKKE